MIALSTFATWVAAARQWPSNIVPFGGDWNWTEFEDTEIRVLIR